MQDRVKIIGLTVIVLLFGFLFIGIGLNADNYQYFLSRRVPKVLAMIVAGHRDRSVVTCFSDHYS